MTVKELKELINNFSEDKKVIVYQDSAVGTYIDITGVYVEEVKKEEDYYIDNLPSFGEGEVFEAVVIQYVPISPKG